MKLLKALLLISLFAHAAITVAAESNLTASIRIGATFVDNETTDSDFSISNFGSRIKWSGKQEYDNGLTGIGYIELGINPDQNSRGNSGADRTRHLWAGLAGDFGKVKVGAQYAAFYDLVSGHTDIAWWGSCWTQFECARETRVLKYSGSTGAFNYSASLQGNNNDDGNDPADELEFGFNYNAGPVLVGLATSIRADEGEDEGGTLVGAIAKGSVGPVGLALGLQFADSDFAFANDDVSNTTVSATLGSFYTVLNVTDDGSSSDPFFGTLGYTLGLGDDSLMYFEYQVIDDGTEADSETIIRATYKYDFGVL